MAVGKMHRHEALDRTSMILDIIDSHLYDHPAMTAKDKLILDKAMKQLFKLYQRLGARNAKKT